MKKVLIFKFDIYQDTLGRQKPKPILYINTIPNREDVTTSEELSKVTQKFVNLEITEQRDMPEYLGRTYLCKIDSKLLERIKDEIK